MNKLNKFFITISIASFSAAAMSQNIYQKDNVSVDAFGSLETIMANAATSQAYTNNSLSNDNSIIYQGNIGLATRAGIAPGLDAIAMVQFNINPQYNKVFDNRVQNSSYMFVGVDAYQYGTLIFGNSEDAYYAVSGATDIFNFLQNQANDAYMFGNQLPGQIMYSLSTLGSDLRLSFLTAQDNVNSGPFSIRNGVAFSVSNKFADKFMFSYGANLYDLTYQNYTNALKMRNYFAPILANAYGLDSSQIGDFVKYHEPGKIYNIGGSLSYGYLGDKLYGAIYFGVTDYEYLPKQIYNLEAVVSYNVCNNINLSAGYALKRYNNISVVSNFTTSVNYSFANNFKIYFETQIDLDSKADRFYSENVAKYISDNKFLTGIKYSF